MSDDITNSHRSYDFAIKHNWTDFQFSSFNKANSNNEFIIIRPINVTLKASPE